VFINYIIQQYRKETFFDLAYENRIEDFEDDVDVDKTDDISMEYLIKIIQELPDRYRLVFNLYVIDGYSHQEIAEMLNINIGTSKSNLFRARMSLKGKIESDSNIIKSSIK
jgi:RNA polymerase sigma-70 factor (ECF subfamily)